MTAQRLFEMALAPLDSGPEPTLDRVFSDPVIKQAVEQGSRDLNFPGALLTIYASVAQGSNGEPITTVREAESELDAVLKKMGGYVSGGSYFSDFNICVPANRLDEFADEKIAGQVSYTTHTTGFPAYRI